MSNLNYCIIIPTYNNALSLSGVLEGVLKITNHIIVVNDGSTDHTAEILDQYVDKVTVLTHPVNKGKGMALQTAFEEAISKKFEYAITIDSDGQHLPEEIPSLVNKVLENRGYVVMGSRNMSADGIPKKSSFGNNFSNFWFRAYTTIKLSDTQTGFRAYPLAQVKRFRWFTSKFEFEIEVIVRLAWSNVKFVEQPISVKYPEERVSHFRPLKDFTRISILNTVFFVLAVAFFLPRHLIRNFSLKKLFGVIKKEFKGADQNPNRSAASVGLGLFFGVAPIWGFQMLVAVTIGTFCKLNRVLILLFSNISLPPLVPLIIYFSFWFGGFFVENRVTLVDLDELTLDTIGLQVKQYLIGAFLLASILGVAGFLITKTVLSLAKLFSSKK